MSSNNQRHRKLASQRSKKNNKKTTNATSGKQKLNEKMLLEQAAKNKLPATAIPVPAASSAATVNTTITKPVVGNMSKKKDHMAQQQPLNSTTSELNEHNENQEMKQATEERLKEEIKDKT